MRSKLLLLPIALLAFLVLLLVPMIPITTFLTPTCHSALCYRIPPYATELPNGQYTFVTYESILYSLFHLGGYLIIGFPVYLVKFPIVNTDIGGLLFYVAPLCIFDAALFIFAFFVHRSAN